MPNTNAFCSYPFNSLFLSGNAEYKFCCASRTILGDANSTTVEEAMNSEAAKEIRQHMLEHKWHPNCVVCKDIENIGGKSTRTQETWVGPDDTFNDESFILEFVDLRWNNTCNLSCNYCVPEFSHHWARMKNEKITRIAKENEQQLLDFIEKHKDTVKKVMLLGGEPLLHKQNLPLTDIVPNAFYYILTNLALEKLQDNPNVNRFLTLPHFDWGVSFETIGPRFEYVRHGADWDTFVQNLKFIDGKTSENGFKFSAHPLYGLYSAYNIIEYYDFVYEHNLFSNGGIWWQSLLNNSGGLINKMTYKMKDAAIKEIERCEIKYPEASGLDMLIELKNHMIEDLDKPESTDHMLEVLAEFDRLENNWLTNKTYKFNELWPQVYEWLIEGASK
jgi:hypothetical protein